MEILVVTNMYPSVEEPAFGTFVGDQVEALRREGVHADVLVVNGRASTLQYICGIPRLWWRLLRKRYDVLHAHHPFSGLIARSQWWIPVVTTYHGGEVLPDASWWRRALALLGARVFTGIIAVNGREQAILGGLPRVHVIPCGVDPGVFAPMPRAEARALLGLPQDVPLILWAGEHWQPEKRFDLVSAVVERVKRTSRAAELVVVSGQPHAVVPRYMNACDVLLLCSSSEGSPMVVKEAMACGLPVVSTDAGDVREILKGVEGCAVVESDPDAIAGALVPLLLRPRRTEGRVVAARYDSRVVAQKIIEVYEDVSGRRRRVLAERGNSSGMDQASRESHSADRGSGGRSNSEV